MPLMATNWRCFLIAVLIAAVEIKRAGCMVILSSRKTVSLQEGEKLSLNCTLSYHKEEAMGLIIFWCKNKTEHNCSPETSLQLLKLRREVEVGEKDTWKKLYTSFVFTIPQARMADSGIYQCCASRQNPSTSFQGHYIFVTITEKGNYTKTELPEQKDDLSSHSGRAFKTSPLKEKIWVLMITGLLALKGMSRKGDYPSMTLGPWTF
ncbi:CD160 antigen isoform X2 [Dromiciops gliroides]|uniref:CD160 antigen isoform X2 n=1 Tax=Dromiciops gliroides TaxID=33562 RepID=UPI001CC43F93|nr:CD160 antigen isoform X2 [Dromiciops gliroides]